MALLRINKFGGEIPKRDKKDLAPFMAETAKNCKLYKKRLMPWRGLQYIGDLSKPGPIQTLYLFDEQYWFHWDSVVDVARSQIPGTNADDPVPFERTYYAGDGTPKVTDSSIATSGGGTDYPAAAYELGIPAPETAPVASDPTPSDPDVVETVQYVYTYVRSWQGVESEGPPSPVSNESSVTPGDLRTISGMETGPAGAFNITHKRIYRVATGDLTSAFQFVGEVELAIMSFDDSILTEELGYVLPSTTWDPPPDDLHSIVSMPNGMMAGLSGNRLCFCEPYQPHAWPVDYRLGLEYAGVSLGVYGQSVVVATNGLPYLATGVHPAAMSLDKLQLKQACVSKRSLVDMGEYVVYASPEGLVAVGIGIQKVVTFDYFHPDEWQTLNPASMRGYYFDGRYICFYDNGTEKAGFVFDPSDPDAGYTTIDSYATAGFSDPENGDLYLVIDDQVYKWDADAAAQLTYVWKSGTLVLPSPVNPGAAQVIAENYPVTFRLYGDGVLRHTEEVQNDEGFRLPSGYLAKNFEIEIEGSNKVDEVLLGQSMIDLRAA